MATCSPHFIWPPQPLPPPPLPLLLLLLGLRLLLHCLQVGPAR